MFYATMSVMKVSFVLNCGLYSKRKSGFCLKNTMILIQDMFENEKAEFVLKTVKGFNIKELLY